MQIPYFIHRPPFHCWIANARNEHIRAGWTWCRKVTVPLYFDFDRPSPPSPIPLFFRWTPLPPPQVEENLAKWRSSFSFFDLEHTVSSTCWWFDLFLENYLKTKQCKYDSNREFHDSWSFIFKPSKLEFASGECKGARITVSKEKIKGTRQTYLITRTVALSHSQLNHSSQNAFVTEQRSTLNCVEPKVGRW